MQDSDLTDESGRLPIVEFAWAADRRIDYVVALAIHIVANGRRSPEQIAAMPSKAERKRIGSIVGRLVTAGQGPRQPEGQYNWGDDPIVIALPVSVWTEP